MKEIKGTYQLTNSINDLISKLNEEQYKRPLDSFSWSTVGQHVRHILEFYQEIINAESKGEINYDARARNLIYETNQEQTIKAFSEISNSIATLDMNKQVLIISDLGTEHESKLTHTSTYGRELIYAFDHAIHHLAIIKMGIKLHFPEISLPTNLGVAPSTIRNNMSKCAQ